MEQSRVCTKCGQTKLLSAFHKSKRGKYGRRAQCKECASAYEKELYYRSSKRRNRIVAHNKNKTEANKETVYRYLLSHPCVDCGETDPIKLEFDHRDHTQKKYEIGQILAQGYCLTTIMNEIAKCDVRCASCHRVRTAEQQNWWIWQRTHTK